MKIVRTAKIPIDIPVSILKPTVLAYTKAFNHVCLTGWNSKEFNGVALHHLTYKETRKYLNADLAISARVRATESLKSAKALLKKKKQSVSCPKSKLCSIRYNSKTLTIWFNRNEVSISTINGRVKGHIQIPKYYKQYSSWKCCSSDLVLHRKKAFLHIVFETNVSDPVTNGKVVGIDRGQNRIAVTSNHQFFGGGHVKHISERYCKLRKKLQKVGTRSAKRHLRTLGSKENRFRRDANHCISKEIVSSLQSGTTIVLEDLTNINKHLKIGKEQREQRYRWSFFQLEQFLRYKATALGIFVEYVDPRYTSQKCSVCGHIEKSNRKNQTQFRCKSCGFQLNADLNASRNILNNFLLQNAKCYSEGAAINQPIVIDSCSE